MKTVLFLSFSAPPILDPESIQVGRYVKYLSGWDWNPYLVASDRSIYSILDDDLLEMIPSSVYVERVKPWQFRLKRVWRQVAPWLLSIPDDYWGWFWPAYCTARKISVSKRVDLVHTWSQPFTTSLVGLRLKKDTALPWVVHFSDPWTDSPYRNDGRICKCINAWMEKLVIQYADAIVFTTEETRRLVLKKYPFSVTDRSFVIPHCYDPGLTLHSEKFCNRGKVKLTLTYTGNFYGIRTPYPLYRALKKIKDQNNKIEDVLHVQLIGTMERAHKTAVNEFGLDGFVSIIDRVSYFESLYYLKNSDCLLLIDAPAGRKESVFLPSKLVDYIYLRKPILGITPLLGASANLIRQVGGIVVAPEDIEGIAAEILRILKFFLSGRLSYNSQAESVIERYSAKNTVKELAHVFEYAMSNGRR